MAVAAGIDVGKVNLEVSVSEGPVVRFAKPTEGITDLLSYLKARGTKIAVCESTDVYERRLVRRVRETGIVMHVAHPSRVRSFARACGYEAKTDPRDAQVLSRYGQVFVDSESPVVQLEPEREELQELLRRRRQLMEQRVQEISRLDKGVSPTVARSTKRHIAWLEKEDCSSRPGVPGGAAEQRPPGSSRRPISHRARGGAVDRGHTGSLPA